MYYFLNNILGVRWGQGGWHKDFVFWRFENWGSWNVKNYVWNPTRGPIKLSKILELNLKVLWNFYKKIQTRPVVLLKSKNRTTLVIKWTGILEIKQQTSAWQWYFVSIFWCCGIWLIFEEGFIIKSWHVFR